MIAGPAATTAAADARAPAWRTWIAVFGGFLLASGGVLWLSRGVNREVEVLATVAVYLSFACTFLPLPSAWILLWGAREAGPIAVALAGTVGTCIANLHDYHALTALRRTGPLRRAMQSAWYARAAAWFGRSPFVALAASSFLPLPVDAVRLLAISVGYPRPAFVLASFAGRLPRYLVFALLGRELALSNSAIVAVLAATVVIGAAKAAHAARRRRGARAKCDRREG
jgi:membrane protein YqaA with SNARE-associated domain